jgi:hypothetical protein
MYMPLWCLVAGCTLVLPARLPVPVRPPVASATSTPRHSQTAPNATTRVPSPESRVDSSVACSALISVLRPSLFWRRNSPPPFFFFFFLALLCCCGCTCGHHVLCVFGSASAFFFFLFSCAPFLVECIWWHMKLVAHVVAHRRSIIIRRIAPQQVSFVCSCRAARHVRFLFNNWIPNFTSLPTFFDSSTFITICVTEPT